MESGDQQEQHQQSMSMEVKQQQPSVEVKEDPTEVRYVLTQKGGQALLYGGHCFYKVRDGENRKTFWRCSKYRTESCEVRVTTLEDQVVGIRGQHRHPAENNSDRIRASSETQLNWIRNRRRPNAAKMAEKLAEKIAPYTIAVTSSLPSSLPTLIPSNPTSLPTLTTLPHPMVVTTTNHHSLVTPGLIRVADTATHHHSIPFPSQLTVPDPKRICLQEHNSHYNHTSSPTSVTPHSSLLLVKVRISGSGESDFVEAEVAPPTYHALVSACCEELELNPSDVAKIRKLPNVLVRKDRDVQRMADGQELEAVLKGDGPSMGGLMSVISPPAAAASYPTTSVLTVNPFAPPTTAVLTLSNQAVQVQRGSPVTTTATVTTEGLVAFKTDENGTPNHITGVTSDSGEVQNHILSHAHQPTTVNGLQ